MWAFKIFKSSLSLAIKWVIFSGGAVPSENLETETKNQIAAD